MPLMAMGQDTRKLLVTAGALMTTGVVSAVLMLTAFGGITRHQGPHTNLGWLALMVAMGCLPTGVLTLVLGVAKLVGERNKK